MASAVIVPTVATQWAALALLCYDTFLTLDQEIALVWNSAWALPKGLYFLIRYLALAWAIVNCGVSLANRSPQFCGILNVGNTVALLLAAAADDALLMLRVLALLKDKRKWCIALKSLYGVIYIVIFAMLCYDLGTSPIRSSSATGGLNLGCTALTPNLQSSPSLSEILLPIATAPILAFNVLLLMIVLFKIFPQYRAAADLRTPLLTLIVRDGAIYFVIMCSSLAFVTVTPLALYKQPTMSMLSLSPFLSISPIAACRLFLNLRAQAARPSVDMLLRSPDHLEFSAHASHLNTTYGISTIQDEAVDAIPHCALAYDSALPQGARS